MHIVPGTGKVDLVGLEYVARDLQNFVAYLHGGKVVSTGICAGFLD